MNPIKMVSQRSQLNGKFTPSHGTGLTKTNVDSIVYCGVSIESNLKSNTTNGQISPAKSKSDKLKRRRLCYFCRQHGHYIRECPIYANVNQIGSKTHVVGETQKERKKREQQEFLTILDKKKELVITYLVEKLNKLNRKYFSLPITNRLAIKKAIIKKIATNRKERRSLYKEFEVLVGKTEICRQEIKQIDDEYIMNKALSENAKTRRQARRRPLQKNYLIKKEEERLKNEISEAINANLNNLIMAGCVDSGAYQAAKVIGYVESCSDAEIEKKLKQLENGKITTEQLHAEVTSKVSKDKIVSQNIMKAYQEITSKQIDESVEVARKHAEKRLLKEKEKQESVSRLQELRKCKNKQKSTTLEEDQKESDSSKRHKMIEQELQEYKAVAAVEFLYQQWGVSINEFCYLLSTQDENFEPYNMLKRKGVSRKHMNAFVEAHLSQISAFYRKLITQAKQIEAEEKKQKQEREFDFKEQTRIARELATIQGAKPTTKRKNDVHSNVGTTKSDRDLAQFFKENPPSTHKAKRRRKDRKSVV